jgi:hypothetical protein
LNYTKLKLVTKQGTSRKSRDAVTCSSENYKGDIEKTLNVRDKDEI